MMKQIKNRVRQLGVTLTLLALLVTQALAAVPAYLIPGGNTVGIKLYTRGLVVTAVSDGMAAQAAGLKAGDTILAADGDPVRTAQSLCAHLQEGKPVVLTVLRGEQEAKFLVSPEKTEDGCRLGLTLRDHIAGIGTVTYYDPDSRRFGALGHGITDMDTAQLMSLSSGSIMETTVKAVKKGLKGEPGELRGDFTVQRDVGTLTANTNGGIFGKVADAGFIDETQAIPVAAAWEVKCGPATILATVNGSDTREYQVEILRLYGSDHDTRNLMLKVTDPQLLAATGGIVQGMSGSPILQNGKFVGAVTHVLIDDPARGYGIFMENMLKMAG